MNLWTVYGWQLPARPDRELFRRLAEMGVQAVELVVDEDANSAENLLAHRHEIAALLAEFAMVVPSIASGLFWRYNLGSSDERIRRRAVEIVNGMCRVADAYGAGAILIVAGQQEPHTPYALTWSNAVRSIRAAARLAADLDLQIGVENVASSFLTSPGEMAHFLADVNHPSVGCYLDLGNAMFVLNGYAENWCTALAGRIVRVHVKDVSRRSHQIVNCGQGDLPWPEVLPVLRECGYDGHLMIETPPEPAGSLEDGFRAARESLEGMRHAVPALRPLPT